MIGNPYALLAAGAVVVGAVAGAFFYGQRVGKDACEAAEAREKRVAQVAYEAANKAAGEAISKIEVQNVTIRQTVEREIREKPVYRDCRHTPDGLRGVNAAITGRAEPAGAGQLPGASAPR